MTTSLQTPTSTPAQAVGQAAGTAGAVNRFGKRLVLVILIIAAVFLATYAFAWYNAYQLSQRFYQNADSSFQAGNYMDSLVGYQEFDPNTNRYINYGGYVSVEKIWSNRYSSPQPPFVETARQRSQEIIQQKLSVDQAEQYILENTGRPGAPYFGEIYLRLGGLYEQQGDIADATSVYQSMPGLFPNRQDLIQQAQERLAALESQGK